MCCPSTGCAQQHHAQQQSRRPVPGTRLSLLLVGAKRADDGGEGLRSHRQGVVDVLLGVGLPGARRKIGAFLDWAF